jgi:AcrR family transcriptional regulator
MPKRGATSPKKSRTPKARPGATRGDARQERLLEQLESIFLAEGYRRSTVGELSARLRCSRRALYELAPSKEALFVTVLDRVLARVRDAGRRAAASEAPVAERIEAFLAPGIESMRSATQAFSSDLTALPAARKRVEMHQLERMAGLRALVTEGVRNGTFRGFDPQLVAEVFSFAWRRVTEPDFLAQSRLTMTEAYRELSQLLRHGLLHAEAEATSVKRRRTG